MQRLYDFIRRHPTGVDSFWAVFLLGISGMTIVVGGDADGGRVQRIAIVPIVIGLCTVVALRFYAHPRRCCCSPSRWAWPSW